MNKEKKDSNNKKVPEKIDESTQKSSFPGKPLASLILGIIGLIAWIIPIIGFAVQIPGLILGIKSLKSEKKAMAIVGITLSIIGLVASIANASIGAYLGVIGEHEIVNELID